MINWLIITFFNRVAYGIILFPFIFRRLRSAKNTNTENSCWMPILSVNNPYDVTNNKAV